MEFFKVEIYKILKNKKYLIFLIGLLVLFIFKTYGLYGDAKSERPEIKIKNNEKLLVEYKAKLKEDEIKDEEIKTYKLKIKSLERENKELSEEIKNPNYNWKEKLTNKNKALKKEREEYKIAMDYNEVERINGEILLNEHLLKENMEPQPLYKIYSFRAMKDLMGFINVIFLPLLIIILTYDSVSSEMQYSTIKLAITKPIGRVRFIITKFLSGFLVSILTVFIIEFFMFVIIGLVFNRGNPSYPVVIGTKYHVDELERVTAIIGSSYIVPVYKYLIQLLLLQLMCIFVYCSFGILISTLFKNNVASLMVSSIIIFCLNMATFILPQESLSKIYPYLFTTYGDGNSLIEGVINLKLNSTSISIPLGISVCILWGVVFLVVAFTYFKRKDIVI